MSIPGVNTYTHQFLASAARTASGVSTATSTGRTVKGVVVELDVTAASGTGPTLTVELQDSFDGVNWNKVSDVATGVSATGRTVLRLDAHATPVTNRFRVSYTIGGTDPSFTFSVNAYIVQE